MLVTILITTKNYQINSSYTHLQTRAVLIKYDRSLVEPLGHHLKVHKLRHRLVPKMLGQFIMFQN